MANIYKRWLCEEILKTPSSRPILTYFEFRSKSSLITVIWMDRHSPKKFIATKYSFIILREDTSFFFLIISLYLSFFFFVILRYYWFLQKSFYYYYFILFYFFMKIIFIFSCSGMFRNVPACSGMFRVPGFIDGRLQKDNA